MVLLTVTIGFAAEAVLLNNEKENYNNVSDQDADVLNLPLEILV